MSFEVALIPDASRRLKHVIFSFLSRNVQRARFTDTAHVNSISVCDRCREYISPWRQWCPLSFASQSANVWGHSLFPFDVLPRIWIIYEVVWWRSKGLKLERNTVDFLAVLKWKICVVVTSVRVGHSLWNLKNVYFVFVLGDCNFEQLLLISLFEHFKWK